MSEDVGELQQEPEGTSAAAGHCSYFEGAAVSAQSLARAIAVFPLPDTSHATVASMLFGGRASVHTVRAWRTGKRYVAPWAIELLKTKHRALGAALEEIKTGPGMQAGWFNVAGRLANR